MIETTEKKNAWNHIVAWIDLLGQSSLMNSVPAIRLSEHDKEIVQEAASNLNRFRTELAELNNTAKQIFRDKFKRELEIQISFIADSALFSISFEGRNSSEDVAEEVCLLLYQLNTAIVGLLANKLVVRGAIELGICITLADKTLYGPALSRAVRLEKDAIYPRFLIGKHLFDYLNYYPQNLTVQECLRLIDADDDSALILNYLKDIRAKAAEIHGSSENKARTSLKNAQAFIEDRKKHFKDKMNLGIYQKYAYLERFFKQNSSWDIP